MTGAIRILRLGLAGMLIAGFLLTGSLLAADAEPRIEKILVDSKSVIVHAAGVGPDFKLVEIGPYEGGIRLSEERIGAEGKTEGETVRLKRFERGRDRLYSGWQLVAAEGGKAVGPVRYANDLSKLSSRTDQFPKPASIKGVQCIVGVEDALRLGIKQGAHNVLLSEVIDLSGKPSKEYWQVDGKKIPIRSGYIRHLDGVVSQLTRGGVNLSLILLNSVPTEPQPGNPLIHPRTNLKEAPNHLGGFNLTSEEGYLYYRGAIEYLAQRYSRPKGEFGRVTGYIVGNELQAHWWWYNIGEALPDEVIADYARALRVAHYAIRKAHPELRAYVSMDHHWTGAMSPNEKRFIPGKRFLDGLNEKIRNEGNIEWHVASHPYPENLFNPRTWEDKEPTLSFETPKITFKNLEVLPAYLRKEEFLFEGRPRRIILSEQGFHTPDGPDGEKIQAAAYAYAYARTVRMEGIDAFILHRHIDHQHEGGLRLGIRARKEGTVTDPGEKKYLYEVFQKADEKDWETAFEFAKPILGIENWEEVGPRPIP
ncbi:MAG: hypothetical protein KDA68_07020 [Planctomycetaceae bacterium]|nr:hypothetical protein [Planctomycetaceae bacterium]